MIEPLLTSKPSSLTVAKVFVDPQVRVTVCQVVSIGSKSVTIPVRKAIGTITPVDLCDKVC